MKITLDEESIDNVVKYIKDHPKEIYELLEIAAAQAIDVLMKEEVLEKGADLYKKIKKEIQSSLSVTIHKCPQCRAHPLKKVKGRLYCNECGWTE
ncbi:MAG: hypothetical protein JSW60_05425 [Thermoplasmatales archaeon]|nr:MAG: hypothetical protein JSW60_05425 [Thermoplasmatales archaeon]